ncbi:protein YdhK [Enterobacter cancerogenus]|uniref:Protein YdhK n=1 Tax=Enterobacter cancerogenus TaxID=69218 RepID=A0A484Z7F7_9ENTR|nr:protein YdhK [Enterobacter cancerogenus]
MVSFPTVGGRDQQKSGPRRGGVYSGYGRTDYRRTYPERSVALFTGAWPDGLGFCTWACAHFTNNVAYAFQLAGYTAAIIAFPVVNVLDTTELWDIAQARVCEVIVGILCGGVMMMILPSTSDGTALITALKTMHARLLEHASLLWQPDTNDDIRLAHEKVIGRS